MFRTRFLPRAVFCGLAASIILSLACVALAAAPKATDKINATLKGTYATGVFDESAAEIVAFDHNTKRAFVVNGNLGGIDVLDFSDPSNPTLITQIDLSTYGGGVNSVAYHGGVVAAAVENDDKQADGAVVLMDTDGVVIKALDAGALPDMVTFSPNGNYVVVANEGEPNDDYDNDPEGSVTVVDLSDGAAAATAVQATFTAFNGQEATLAAQGVRVFGPGATLAQDFEPEYIAVSKDSSTAYVSCQENNALAVVDLASATVTDIFGFGFKDYSVEGNGLDASDRDDAINITNYDNLYGIYMPDSIALFEDNGNTYIVTANEGDSRDYDGYSEEERVADLTLDPTAFPNAAALQDDAVLGRLHCTSTLGDTDGDGDYDEIYAFGARSFSIFQVTDSGLILTYDSGDDFSEIIAELYPEQFNSNNDDNDSFDSRSDDKAGEPEALTLGMIDGKRFAFVGLERMGGFFIYNISNPAEPSFVNYVTDRDFTGDPEAGTAGDLAPEGMAFVKAADSPNGEHMLLVASEVSGTTSAYTIKGESDDDGGCVLNPNADLSLEWFLVAFALVAFAIRRRIIG